ncbi:MAG: class I SAM-dependent methyltransferase [Sphingobacteriales bacterium]|nr:MAG: class I SAM-dependent methyltransferase [Sphingobacteriales bacterium]
MSNQLTDRKFWESYWESKTGLITDIPSNYLFSDQLSDTVRRNDVKTAIELGGFPGYYAVFLKKHLKLDVTLLDYFIHPPVTNALLKQNRLKEGDISIIEADLFSYVPEKKYDLVLSCGLIEHFEDTADIIKRHITFLKPGGVLFITLPNFNAVNGWFQKRFDRDNYDKHNIASMDPNLIKQICENEGLTVKTATYFGGFSIWFENEQQKPTAVRILKKLTWLAGKVFTKIISFESKALSPYIIVEAVKK